MARIVVKTTIGGAFANVTSVTLADPTGTFGVRQGERGPVVVPAGTAMVNTGPGIYEYEFTEPAAGVDYLYWAQVTYGGETHHFEYTYRAPLAAVEIELGPFDELLAAEADGFLTAFGEQGIYHPAIAAEREITVIVLRQAEGRQDEPRTRLLPVRIQAKNDAVTGIVPGTWTDRDHCSVRLHWGGPLVKLRMVRPVSEDAGLVTWELN